MLIVSQINNSVFNYAYAKRLTENQISQSFPAFQGSLQSAKKIGIGLTKKTVAELSNVTITTNKGKRLAKERIRLRLKEIKAKRESESVAADVSEKALSNAPIEGVTVESNIVEVVENVVEDNVGKTPKRDRPKISQKEHKVEMSYVLDAKETIKAPDDSFVIRNKLLKSFEKVPLLDIHIPANKEKRFVKSRTLAHWKTKAEEIRNTYKLSTSKSLGPNEYYAPAGSPVAINGFLHVEPAHLVHKVTGKKVFARHGRFFEDGHLVDKYGKKIFKNEETEYDFVGAHLVNQYGKITVLKGFSTADILSFPTVDGQTIHNLRELGTDRVRPAMYVHDWEGYWEKPGLNEKGYLNKPKATLKKLYKMIQECIDEGMYVIIDWHIIHDPSLSYAEKSACKNFFKHMAKKYKGKPNIFIENCNEPALNAKGKIVQWNGRRGIKSFHDYTIPAIKDIDPSVPIIAGTDTWSQGMLNAGNNPLVYDNILHSLHFYTLQDTHRKLILEGDVAFKRGISGDASEIGLTTASGQGSESMEQIIENAEPFYGMIARNKWSHNYWALENRAKDGREPCSALPEGASMAGNPFEFTEMAQYAVRKMQAM